MERVIEIVSTHQIDSVLDASFVLNGKRRTLTSEFDYVDRDIHSKEEVQPMTIPFTRRASRKVIKYKVDDKGEPLTPMDRKIENTIQNFYMLHPLTMLNGKHHPNTANGAVVYYDIIDINQKVVTELKKWHNKLAVMNDLAGKTLAEIRDICFLYGLPPKGKTKGGLLIDLAEYNKGHLFVTHEGVDKSEHYIATFINNQDPDKVLTINANKAIDYGVVSKRISEGGQISFYLGNELLGTTFEDVVKFFKQNPDMYERYILKGIREKDQFDGEEAGSEVEKVALKDKDPSDPMIVEVFRKEVLDLQEKMMGLLGKDVVAVRKTNLVSAGYPKLKEAHEKLIAQEVEYTASQAAK